MPRSTGLIREPHGILLVTGPTGSGKTTTLYAALSRLPRGSVNLMTVEDPIEYALDGVAQTQVNPRIELDFARSLRSILRQDPDVIMIGEIRDLETAQIAVQASLTGHLVLATLHTNDAASAVTRLADMGVEPYLLVLVAARRARAAAGPHVLPRVPEPVAPDDGESCDCSHGWACRTPRGPYAPKGCDRAATPATGAAPASTSSWSWTTTMRRAIHDRGVEARAYAAPCAPRYDGAARATACAGSPTARPRSPSSSASRATPRAGARAPLPAWDYEAVDATGKLARGTLEADSARGARDRLRAQGLTPTDIDEAPRDVRRARSVRALPARELALFTRQWATLRSRGCRWTRRSLRSPSRPIRRAWRTSSPRCAATSGRASRCRSRSRAFRAASRPSTAAWSAAGAESGRLPEVLARLADYLEARQALRQKFIVALIYPALVTVVALGVIAVLLVYVVPQVVAVYEHSRQTLPWLTRALIATS